MHKAFKTAKTAALVTGGLVMTNVVANLALGVLKSTGGSIGLLIGKTIRIAAMPAPLTLYFAVEEASVAAKH